MGFLVFGIGLSAEENDLNSYRRNFARADLEAKVSVVRDAAADEGASEFVGQFYEFILKFSLQNAEVLQDDVDFITLTMLASFGVGAVGHKASENTLWSVFSAVKAPAVRVAALGSMALLAPGNPWITENLNHYVVNQNELIRSGAEPDYLTLSACISTLGALKDGSSVPVLLGVMTSGYKESITAEAAAVLKTLPANYYPYLINVIRQTPPAEKLAAYTVAIDNENFSDKRGELAEIALEVGLTFPGSGKEVTALNDMRYAAAVVLGELKWSRAANLVIRHYYRVQQDYQEGKAPRERLAEAIACMGVMGSSDAARALTFQLGYLNSLLEQHYGYDDANVVIEVVNALGELGDKAAYDPLLYMSYLPYPEEVKTAAKEARDRLKW
ncbi:hypothetical protein AGMMS49991_04340 [Spirochaetia bacterium]|nr:hypothetical protein AGMMS49991_04340 [Spirochaetia bacterium]